MTNIRSVSVSNGEQALRTIQRVNEALESIRYDLAQLYASATGGSPVEHEVGECLTKVRAAVKRAREAVGELAQMELPLE